MNDSDWGGLPLMGCFTLRQGNCLLSFYLGALVKGRDAVRLTRPLRVLYASFIFRTSNVPFIQCKHCSHSPVACTHTRRWPCRWHTNSVLVCVIIISRLSIKYRRNYSTILLGNIQHFTTGSILTHILLVCVFASKCNVTGVSNTHALLLTVACYCSSACRHFHLCNTRGRMRCDLILY